MSALLDALGWVGESLDKPGRAVRGLLAGRPEELLNLVPFSDTAGITDPGRSVSGRNLLEQWGALSPREEGEGFGFGDVLGIGLEAALDPTNLIGAGSLKRLAGLRNAALAKNAERELLLAKGAMPEEVARATKITDEAGNPLKTFHGTPHVYDQYDISKMDEAGLYGPGIYTTVDPKIASEYAEKGAKDSIYYQSTPAFLSAIEKRESEVLPALESYIDLEKRLSRKPMGSWTPQDREALARISNLEAQKKRLVDIRKALNESGEVSKEVVANVLPDFSPTLERIEQLAPRNVRSQFLDIRNPFNIDAYYNPNEAADLLKKMGLGSGSPLEVSGMTGDMIYNELTKALGSKSLANQHLKDFGYDAIKHTGGGRMGDVAHQVYIALDPSQVYKPLVVGGPQDIPQLSPLLAALGAHNVLARQ